MSIIEAIIIFEVLYIAYNLVSHEKKEKKKEILRTSY